MGYRRRYRPCHALWQAPFPARMSRGSQVGVQPGRGFETTRWSLVLAARDAESTEGREALAALCELYWTPVYAYIRRVGRTAEDARDLTQAFFTAVIERDFFGKAQPDRGRFRSFLLTSVRHFLSNEHHAAMAQKRGAGQVPVSLDHRDEGAAPIEPVESVTPEALYERRWAEATLDEAVRRTRAKYEQRGQGDVFDRLRPFLTGDEPSSYAELSATLGVSEGSLRVAVHRVRDRFAQCARQTVAETVSRPEEVDDELKFLRSIIGR